MNAVRLKIASFSAFAGGGFEGETSNITVKVQNLALFKDVALHYNNHGEWTEEVFSWSANFGDYDLFSISKSTLVDEFVVRYSVGGQTFWDNNDGLNYHFGGHGAVIGGNIVLNKAIARRGTEAGGGFVFDTSWIEGEIDVNNLSPVKEVGILLSEDGGTTWKSVSASFAGPATSSAFDSSSSERWTFKSPELNLNHASDHFRFALFYHNVPSGELFWDNNFSQDYTVSKVDGSTLQ
jgi:hypothetical protein